MAYKQIQVNEHTHAKVSQIARNNYRGIGDQISLWADTTCEHPIEAREAVNIVVAPVLPPTKKQTARVGENQPYRGFYCAKCGNYIFNGEHKEAIAQAMNAPLIGKTSKA